MVATTAALIGTIEIPLSYYFDANLSKLYAAEVAKQFEAVADAPNSEAARETLREPSSPSKRVRAKS